MGFDELTERDVAGDLIPVIALGGVTSIVFSVLLLPVLQLLGLSLAVAGAMMFAFTFIVMNQYEWDEEAFSPEYDNQVIGGRNRTIEKPCTLEENNNVCIDCNETHGHGIETVKRDEFVLLGLPISTDTISTTYQCEKCVLEEKQESEINMEMDSESSVEEELEALTENTEKSVLVE